ncbi:MAG TPA: alginate lyase family protein [Gemmatimonadota bacterium]|nr:alginate lyase family protein [Gemmatimonadota bacterium]
MKIAWYVRRLSRMSPREVTMRVRDAIILASWWVEQRTSPGDRTAAAAPSPRGSPAPLPTAARGAIVPVVRERLLAAADRLLEGRWRVFDRVLDGFGADWDWFLDPRTGRRAPAKRFAPGIDHRNEARVGNVKVLWDLSRHQHLTFLAAAYYLSGDERYVERVREHLSSWWRANPFLRGIHWTSGIEIGMRLIAWTWIRRLVDEWPGASDLFERNPSFCRQLADHRRYVSRLQSHGSSANNHLIAELAGLFISSCAFPSGPDASGERERVAARLRAEIDRQTFPDGINRELASEYHGFVLELLLAAALEGEAAGCSLGVEAWETIRRMVDGLAAVSDCRNRPPRKGDGDDAHGLLLDDPTYDRWNDLLDTGARLFGSLPWWPAIRAGSVRAPLWTSLAALPVLPDDRLAQRPALFPHAGFAILRSGAGSDEIWCHCDHGPLGFLSPAAHGHADALSVELRVGGVEVLTDPGTYCYHGEPPWRAYFRSTLAHNTLELGRQDQSRSGGPFLWLDSTSAWLVEASGLEGGVVARWHAIHGGYERLEPAALHERTVELDRSARTVTIRDLIRSAGPHEGRLAFHLGPRITVRLQTSEAMLAWTDGGRARRATLELPAGLDWTAVEGETNPPLGWYSERFGSKRPTVALVGRGVFGGGDTFLTRLAVS